MSTHHVYRLYNPNCRYVGLASNVYNRLYGPGGHRASHLRGVVDSLTEVRVLEFETREKASIAEAYWIDREQDAAADRGERLINRTPPMRFSYLQAHPEPSAVREWSVQGTPAEVRQALRDVMYAQRYV